MTAAVFDFPAIAKLARLADSRPQNEATKKITVTEPADWSGDPALNAGGAYASVPPAVPVLDAYGMYSGFTPYFDSVLGWVISAPDENGNVETSY